MKKIFSLFLILNIYFVSFAIYLENVPTQLVQPNGEILKLFITGDEFFRRVHDSDGYTILPGKDGWYYYAMYDEVDDELIPSEFVVTFTQKTALPMPPELCISQKKYMDIRRAFYEPSEDDPLGASKNPPKFGQTVNNIVIFIGFADTNEMSHNFETIQGLFNTNEGNNMRDYFKTMSYGKTDVVSHFYPPANGNLLRFYKDIYPRSYFENMGSNHNEEHPLLERAINWVNEHHPIPADIDLDSDNDGRCDFITFVVYGKVGNWNDMLWPHKWTLHRNVFINGKKVFNYNFQLDGSPDYFGTNVFCHEGYHIFGAPDLYHSAPFTGLKAVGFWDIMDMSDNNKPQSMSAYMKYKFGQWIPNISEAKLNHTCEIFPFYTHDGSDPAKPVIYKIPMHGIEFDAVEYRKTTNTKYDAHLPNEGLLIYRINPLENGNIQFNGSTFLDEIYLYRFESYPTSNGSPIYTNGNLTKAPFNIANGRTEFNKNSNPYPFYVDGYKDNEQNINHILYDDETDSFTFFYGNSENRYIEVSHSELQLDCNTGSKDSITVTTNVLWRVSVPEDASEWLAVSKTKGLNTDIIFFSILTTNDTEHSRSAEVSLTGNEQTFTINVTQTTDGNIQCKKLPAEFKTYPNPACSSLNIARPNEGEAQINIFNLLGKVVFTFNIIETAIEIDISSLSAGFYFLKLTENKNTYMQRFIKINH